MDAKPTRRERARAPVLAALATVAVLASAGCGARVDATAPRTEPSPAAASGEAGPPGASPATSGAAERTPAPAVAPAPGPAAPTGLALARAAAAQVGVTLLYDPAYRRIGYPGGDVPADRGVCTDVVVRAFRGIGVDLQREVHEDMRRSFAAYPQLWGLTAPDPNIDHRRVPNLMRWLERRGKVVGPDSAALPGDVVAWRLPNGLLHVGVVAEELASGATHRLVVHNIGAGARREDVLLAFERIGHYRW